jgi:NAD(P)-dependent dehydrogenase (short-subunit alcohol dehydrogenase family)
MTSAQRAVVIGGRSGIGSAVAASQRAVGTDVVVWDIAGGADIVCDISDSDQVDSAVAATIETLGVPTVVTICAGIGHSGLLLDASEGDWNRIMGVNAKGVWLAMRSLARPMLATGGGSIVAISSVSARLVDRSMGLYCASKAALDMVIRVAAAEWAPALRVNGVAPGVTDTPMLGSAPRDGRWLTGVAGRTALGGLGTGDDIAEAVLALHTMTWVTGQILVCDGGLSLRSPINPLGQTSSIGDGTPSG